MYWKLVNKEPVEIGWDELMGIGIQNNTLFRDNYGDVLISTVFLNITFNGPEFETMIFGGEYDNNQWRWSSYDEAEEGHRMAVELVTKIQSERERKLNDLGL